MNIFKTKCYIKPNDSSSEHLKELGIKIQEEEWQKTPCVLFLNKITCFYKISKTETMVFFDDTTSINVISKYEDILQAYENLNQ